MVVRCREAENFCLLYKLLVLLPSRAHFSPPGTVFCCSTQTGWHSSERHKGVGRWLDLALTLREEFKLRMFENRLLRTIFGA